MSYVDRNAQAPFRRRVPQETRIPQHHFEAAFRRPDSGRAAHAKARNRLEFADYRAYVAGDDFRHLDWKAYLRLNRLILKLFEEEEDLPIYFFVDSSQSMNYGQPTKLDYARRVAAALCYIGLANLDRVNVVSFADGVKAELPPQRGKGRIFKIFRFLTDIEAGGETDAKASFKTYCTETRRRGLAVVISDFFDGHGFEAALDILRHFRHDIFVVHIASHEEIDPQLARRTAARRCRKQCDARDHDHAVAAHGLQSRVCEVLRSRSRSYCGKYQLGYVRTTTDFPFEELVLKVFRQGRFLK